MPFGTKETNAKPPAPAKVNFNSLWEKALYPALEKLGYQPVRADQELGALIIQEMLERLYFSDLVLADLSIPNGNVYYEIGIRHAARDTGCVLISADWSKALFDLDQMRQLRFPLPEEEVNEATAAAIQEKLAAGIPNMRDGMGPLHLTVQGYPDPKAVNSTRANSIKGFLEQLSAFQAEVHAARRAPSVEQKDRALAVRDKYCCDNAPLVQAIALELLFLLRDYAGWAETLTFIDTLPSALRSLPLVREQRALAQSKTGDHLGAIGTLEELIRTSGATSEREGMLGGRYKVLYDKASEVDKRKYLDRSIEHYERGMKLDLNDFYPSCNLPALYRIRNDEGDDDLALTAGTVSRVACERTLERNPNDPWVRQTLLGTAFQAGDVAGAKSLLAKIRREGGPRWQLETTLRDLERSAALIRDLETRTALESIIEQLRPLASPPPTGEG